jgi:DNA-binding MarR family transcriptional regulator
MIASTRKRFNSRNIRMSKEKRRALVAALGMEFRKQQNTTEALDDVAVEILGINRTDGRCLDIIQQNGALTAGQLAEATGLSPGAVTTILDRMEQAGYLQRVRGQEDRRKIMVELTPEAARRTWEIWGPIARWSENELSRYSEAELDFVLEFLRRGRAFMEEYVTKLRARAPLAPSSGAPPKARRKGG